MMAQTKDVFVFWIAYSIRITWAPFEMSLVHSQYTIVASSLFHISLLTRKEDWPMIKYSLGFWDLINLAAAILSNLFNSSYTDP